MAWAAILLMTMTVAGPLRAEVESEPFAAIEAPMFTSEDLDSLVAPVALYPDDLLSLVLIAATEPLQIVQADRYFEARKTDPSLQSDPTWHTAIIGLLNYPEVLKMMSNDLDWTEQLGLAFIYQEEDLMDAVQDFRARVYAAENLRSDENTVIVHEREIIRIVPAEPDIIYVPVYDPHVVVVRRYAPAPLIVYHPYPAYYLTNAPFFTGLFIGFPVIYGFDWHHHHYHVHGWHEHWGHRHIDEYIHHRYDVGPTKDRRHRIIVRRDRRDVRRDRSRVKKLSDHRRIREGRPTRRHEGLEIPEHERRPSGGAGPAPAKRMKERTARESDILRGVAPRKPRQPETTRRRATPEILHDYRRGTQVKRERQRGQITRKGVRPSKQRPSYQRDRRQQLIERPALRDRSRPSIKYPSRSDRHRSSVRRLPERGTRSPAFNSFDDGKKAGRTGKRGGESRRRSSRHR
jgi:hypothetical protein